MTGRINRSEIRLDTLRVRQVTYRTAVRLGIDKPNVRVGPSPATQIGGCAIFCVGLQR
jgi:hypothetical protein